MPCCRRGCGIGRTTLWTFDAEHAGEQEALAWAYAAAVSLDLPLPVLIHEGGYRGKSAELLQMYRFGIYP